jgi:hypothetical protein
MGNLVRVRAKGNTSASFVIDDDNLTDDLTVVDENPSSVQPEYDDVVELPDGDPTDKWTAAQLGEWTKRAGLTVDGTKKADYLAAIAEAAKPPTDPDSQPADGNAG